MKHPNILATQIAIAPFYIPPPAYGEAEAIVVLPPNEANAPAVGALAGDVEPDWGHLEAQYADGKPPETIQAKDPTAISPETPPAPADPAKAPETPEKPPESPDKPAETPVTPEAKPAEAAKTPFDPDAAAKKLEELAVSPKASENTKEGFKNLKSITAEAMTEVKNLRAENAQLRAQAGKLTPEIEAEHKKFKEFYETWAAEHDPEIVKPYTERAEKAGAAFFDMLVKDKALQLPQAEADRIKALGLDSEECQDEVDTLLGKLQNKPLLYERVKDAWKERGAVLRERDAKIEEVRGKQGGYIKAQEEKANAERAEFAGAFNQKMIAAVKDVPWLSKKAIAADATPEAKALAEKHNAYVEKEFVEEIRRKLAAAYHRDPEATAEMVFKAVAHGQVAKERDALAEEKKQLEARVAELTKTAQGVRQVAAAPAKANGAPITPSKEPTKLNQTAEEALEDYLANTRK